MRLTPLTRRPVQWPGDLQIPLPCAFALVTWLGRNRQHCRTWASSMGVPLRSAVFPPPFFVVPAVPGWEICGLAANFIRVSASGEAQGVQQHTPQPRFSQCVLVASWKEEICVQKEEGRGVEVSKASLAGAEGGEPSPRTDVPTDVPRDSLAGCELLLSVG
jgi:hypothetical protein